MVLYFGSFLADLAAVLFVAITCLYLWIRHSFGYWQRRGVPYLTPEFPFGSMKDIAFRRQNLGLHMRRLYREMRATYGPQQPYVGLYMFTRPILMVMDLDIIKTIFIKEFTKFPDRGAYYNEKGDPLSAHMFAIGGAKWKKLRNKISPTFTSGKMKMMFGTLLDVSEHLRRVLHKNIASSSNVDIKELLARFTTDIIGSCVFGLDCNSLENPDAEFRKFGSRFLQTTLSNPLLISLGFSIPRVLRALNVSLIDKEVSAFFMGVLRENIEYREKNKIHRNDFMDMFIKLKNNESIDDEPSSKSIPRSEDQIVTFKELAAQAFVFFIAGFETSSTTSALCLYELANNPHLQDKLRQDIKNTLNKHGGLTYETIMDMKYLDMVINETLRKYPIAPNLIRVCRESYELKVPNQPTLTIEPGTLIWIPTLGIHTDEAYYPDPEKFDPERFSEDSKNDRHTHAYLPFGEGPRNCVGMRFALLQTKVALVQLLKDHTFTLPASNSDLHIEFSKKGLLLFPNGPIEFQVKQINS